MNALSKISQLYGYIMAVMFFLIGVGTLYWGFHSTTFQQEVISWTLGVATLGASAFIYLLSKWADDAQDLEEEAAAAMNRYWPEAVRAPHSEAGPPDPQETVDIPVHTPFTEFVDLFFPRTRSASR
jgi:hypothetical protein